ncbi:EAL domain-containing protein [Scytonema sp. UIC 10036]|uniref:EAL domain-containing response regulator n=1 Tax=Scytonema sp. UIC 10036 TaxID=2304196 RepID=UPI0012DA7D32|nr:EAL domain-containing response regulator [Scytonema sp. UIC 10036]MUG92642.1 EAL domain-containing protein [Scytonema sp. UIC 10036]
MIKILVIEDEESVRENILDLLEAENYDTISAANGKMGLHLAFSEAPDLILCDLMMPEVDGYGVLTALREQILTATIPFIFLTARSARSDFRQGMDLGADDYLTKPFTRAELLNAIVSRLSKQATLKQYINPKNLTHETKAVSPEAQKLEMYLRHTLERRDFRQFQIYYQPIVHINSGKIIAAESLLRWQHPELGMVSPTQVIPIAESTGLIVPIGEWILRSVCKQTKLWHDAGFSFLHIAVNLSVCELIQPEFSQKIIKFLLNNNLVADRIGLELTESMIMQNVDSALQNIQKVNSLGVQIAIDDFGTGYSSLVYLKQLPVNTLKIDRYFIQNVASDPQKAAITTALIQMAHNMNLKVIAEGVETEQELEFLRTYNCDAMQGFLFSRPLPAPEFEKMLIEDKRLVGA